MHPDQTLYLFPTMIDSRISSSKTQKIRVIDVEDHSPSDAACDQMDGVTREHKTLKNLDRNSIEKEIATTSLGSVVRVGILEVEEIFDLATFEKNAYDLAANDIDVLVVGILKQEVPPAIQRLIDNMLSTGHAVFLVTEGL